MAANALQMFSRFPVTVTSLGHDERRGEGEGGGEGRGGEVKVTIISRSKG